MKSKRRKVWAGIMIGVVFAGLLAGGTYLYQVGQYQRTVKGFTYQEKEFSNIPDGMYIGECDVDFIYAKVEVTVKDGEMAEIKLLEHRNERGGPAEQIVDEMVRQQKIDVDVVSGATNSSKVIKKAVEHAFDHVEPAKK